MNRRPHEWITGEVATCKSISLSEPWKLHHLTSGKRKQLLASWWTSPNQENSQSQDHITSGKSINLYVHINVHIHSPVYWQVDEHLRALHPWQSSRLKSQDCFNLFLVWPIKFLCALMWPSADQWQSEKRRPSFNVLNLSHAFHLFSSCRFFVFPRCSSNFLFFFLDSVITIIYCSFLVLL
jgi:hypothetical protein